MNTKITTYFSDSNNVINTPPVTPASRCPNGYTPYWYACYKVYADQLSWPEASNRCKQDGGHLVSVHSDSENAAALVMYLTADVTSDFVWIGLEYLKVNIFLENVLLVIMS